MSAVFKLAASLARGINERVEAAGEEVHWKSE